METFLSKTRFTEYDTTPRGRYFIKAERNYGNQWITIGYIHREYDAVNKKYIYKGKDIEGGPIFADIKDIYTLKKKFIEHGQTLAMVIPKKPNRQAQKDKEPYHGKSNRANEIKNIREKKSSKEKTKEVRTPDSKEKEQDSKNPTKFKETGQNKDGKNQNLKENEQETTKSGPDKATQDAPKDNEPDVEKSDRDIELEQIREDNDDREQEQEQEMEIDM